MSTIKERLSSFFDGYLYPPCLALVVFICHTLSLEYVALSVIFICIAISLALCKDIRAIIPSICYTIFSVSYKTYLSGALGSVSFLILVILCLCLFFGFTIAHFIINKKLSLIKKLPKSLLFWGIIALSGSFLLNGFFNFKGYQAINITFALLLVVFLAFVYALFYTGLSARKDSLEYLIYVLYVASIILVAQMIVLLARDAMLVDGQIIKESLIVGWGSWNNIGGMLAMLLPVHFYYASTKKHGYIFYATALLTYIAIVFTLSRASLLFATIISVICVIIICIKGENVKSNRIITACLAFVGLVGIIVMWDKISTVLSSYLNQGFSDNGRLGLFKHGFENFLSHPIFGGGFGSCAEDFFGHGIEPNRYHNTIIELIATCGIVGLGAYIFHRYQTIKLFWKRKSQMSVIFLGISVLTLLLTSLLDNHFFNLYPTMYYAIILCVIEKDTLA